MQRIYLWRPGRSAGLLGPYSDYIESPAWSPDGKSIAFADERGGWDDPDSTEIYLMDADGAHLRRVVYDEDRPNVFRDEEPSWSPDGKQIVYVRETENAPYEQLVVIDVRTGRERPLHVSGANPAWGKAGIAYVDDYQRIMLLGPASARPRVLARTRSQVSVLAWSPRGVLAAVEDRNRIVLYSASGREVGQFAVPSDATGVCGLAWSHDGSRLLLRTGGRKRGFWTVTPTGRRWRRLPLTPQAGVVDACAVSWR